MKEEQGLATSDSTSLQRSAAMPSSRPWERLPGESSKAYAAFTCYLHLGQNRRLVDADRLYRQQSGRKVPATLSGASGLVTGWSTRYRWAERAAAHEDHLEAQELAAIRRARVKIATRQAERLAKVQDVLATPIDVAAEDPERVADELRKLPASDLVRLARHVAALLPDLQRGERDAMTAAIGEDSRSDARLFVRAEAVRTLLARPDLVEVAETISYQVAVTENPEDG